MVIRSQRIRKEKLISYSWPNLYTNLRRILPDPTNCSKFLEVSIIQYTIKNGRTFLDNDLSKVLVFSHDRQSLVYNAYLSQICVQYSTIKRFFYYMYMASLSDLSHSCIRRSLTYTVYYRSVTYIMLPIFHRYTVYAISLRSFTGIFVFADLSPTVYCRSVINIMLPIFHMRSLFDFSQVFL